MRKTLFAIIAVWSIGHSLYAQQSLRSMNEQTNLGGSITTFNQQGLVGDPSTQRDSTVVDRGVPRDVKMFCIDPTLGTITSVDADTAVYNFQNLHFTDGMNGEYSHLGNMGSPRLSRIFFNRNNEGQFLFANALDFFLTTPAEFHFTNTKSPWSNISYYRAGNKVNGEERFKGRFGVNSGKRTGIGFNVDYLYGRGLYNHQSTAYFDGSLFGYHHGDRYGINLLYSYDKLRLAENGGIADDRYVTNPEAMAQGKKTYRPADMPTNLNRTWNENLLHTIFLSQDYSIGYYKTRTDSLPDTTVTHRDFIPVSKIFHTFEGNIKSRRFIDYANTRNYYADTYLPHDSVDNTNDLSIDNRIALSMCEGFKKWAFANITAFAEFKYDRYLLPDTVAGNPAEFNNNYNEGSLFVGGAVSSTRGKHLRYHAEGSTALIGSDLGAFSLDGGIDLNFKLWKKDINISAKAFMKNNKPSFYYRHYHSEHFWWDNELDREFKTRIEGSIEIPYSRTKLNISVENVKNYTYIANHSILAPNKRDYLNRFNVEQESGNIQVIAASLKQDFKYGIFNLNTEITGQYSSNQTVLPLPALNAYANIYIKFIIAKVLHTEIGADAWYFTSYYAPDYMPALGQFVQQNQADRIKIGNYPIASVYANFLLKQARFYVKYYHVNKGLGSSNYFLVPHHPLNPSVLWFGLSWNFYN